MSKVLFTIGHSNHSSDRLLELLGQHGITAVGDVRSQPYSRFSPQFNRDILRGVLHQVGISYVFLGKELGARSEDETCYENGKVQYDRLAHSDLFLSGLDRVEQGASEYRLALMCAEKEPLDCHRTILVARHLVERGLEIQHILADGSLEPHTETLRRLMAKHSIAEASLFEPREVLEAEACAAQAERISYEIPAEDSREVDCLEDRA